MVGTSLSQDVFPVSVLAGLLPLWVSGPALTTGGPWEVCLLHPRGILGKAPGKFCSHKSVVNLRCRTRLNVSSQLRGAPSRKTKRQMVVFPFCSTALRNSRVCAGLFGCPLGCERPWALEELPRQASGPLSIGLTFQVRTASRF